MEYHSKHRSDMMSGKMGVRAKRRSPVRVLPPLNARSDWDSLKKAQRHTRPWHDTTVRLTDRSAGKIASGDGMKSALRMQLNPRLPPPLAYKGLCHALQRISHLRQAVHEIEKEAPDRIWLKMGPFSVDPSCTTCHKTDRWSRSPPPTLHDHSSWRWPSPTHQHRLDPAGHLSDTAMKERDRI